MVEFYDKETTYKKLMNAGCPKEMIPLVLEEKGLKPDQEKYDKSIIDNCQDVLEALGIAAEEQLALPGNENPSECDRSREIVQQTTAIAQSLLTDTEVAGFSPDFLMTAAQAIIASRVNLARALSSVGQQAFTQELAANNTQFGNQLLNALIQSNTGIGNVFNSTVQNALIGDMVSQMPQSNLEQTMDAIAINQETMELNRAAEGKASAKSTQTTIDVEVNVTSFLQKQQQRRKGLL
ncbi:MAG: hypothetical protein F6K10_34580 [Moorea sp. SIO2B7]|nr:hypothetical protein [Moorena sp. SIO2B7]